METKRKTSLCMAIIEPLLVFCKIAIFEEKNAVSTCVAVRCEYSWYLSTSTFRDYCITVFFYLKEAIL